MKTDIMVSSTQPTTAVKDLRAQTIIEILGIPDEKRKNNPKYSQKILALCSEMNFFQTFVLKYIGGIEEDGMLQVIWIPDQVLRSSDI